MEKDIPIVKVWKNNKSGQKLVTIPKTSGIEAGDHVVIRKVNIGIKKVDE